MLEMLTLFSTCNCESSISTLGGSDDVSGLAPVRSSVLLFLALDHPEEKQRSSRKDDPMRLGAGRGGGHGHAVFVPPDLWLWNPIRLAVESQWLVFCHQHRSGGLGDVGGTVLA